MNLPGVLTSEETYNPHFCTPLVYVTTIEQLGHGNLWHSFGGTRLSFSSRLWSSASLPLPLQIPPSPPCIPYWMLRSLIGLLEGPKHGPPGLYCTTYIPVSSCVWRYSTVHCWHDVLYNIDISQLMHGGTWSGIELDWIPPWVLLVSVASGTHMHPHTDAHNPSQYNYKQNMLTGELTKPNGVYLLSTVFAYREGNQNELYSGKWFRTPVKKNLAVQN